MNKKIVFIFRMSAIGDVVIAARNVQYFVQNHYEPIFVSSILMKDLLLKVKDLKHFICFDEKKEPIYFLNSHVVPYGDFKQYLYENMLEPPLFCDLQNTVRSKRAMHYIRQEFFKQKKIIVNKVKKNFLPRIFLVLFSYLSIAQRKRNFSITSILRVHDLQLDVINKIFLRDKKQTVSHSQNIYLFQNYDSIKKKKYVCMFPGASGSLKRWPKENFKKLIDLFLERTSYDVYICGGKKDEDIGNFLSSHFEENFLQNRVYNVIGAHSLDRSLSLIEHATHVFCNDSFASHVADAYRVSATVIFGGTSPKFGFVPFSSNIDIKYANLNCSPCSRHGKGKCRYGNLKCLTDIHPLEILEILS